MTRPITLTPRQDDNRQQRAVQRLAEYHEPTGVKRPPRITDRRAAQLGYGSATALCQTVIRLLLDGYSEDQVRALTGVGACGIKSIWKSRHVPAPLSSHPVDRRRQPHSPERIRKRIETMMLNGKMTKRMSQEDIALHGLARRNQTARRCGFDSRAEMERYVVDRIARTGETAKAVSKDLGCSDKLISMIWASRDAGVRAAVHHRGSGVYLINPRVAAECGFASPEDMRASVIRRICAGETIRSVSQDLGCSYNRIWRIWHAE